MPTYTFPLATTGDEEPIRSWSAVNHDDSSAIDGGRRHEAIGIGVAHVRRLELPDLMQGWHTVRVSEGARIGLLGGALGLVPIDRPVAGRAAGPREDP